MNEPSPPAEDPVSPPATDVQRILMDRARALAARAQEKPPRRPMQVVASIVFAVLVVLCNLIADVLYAALDPRLRHG